MNQKEENLISKKVEPQYPNMVEYLYIYLNDHKAYYELISFNVV